ncbi:XVIPCD domain-containing protein [Stenotrophomonas sp. ZAC14D2_NAIMI4_6]|uniref:XVIPCD domain-containing protein n=1 Tax=Stenotrophomonas sp. ZAC14D2_NAIMI4_6 TaxID=2072406 RepID=UPI00131F160A|nr:XVIPCD domain-containing protein [Stenotrophomonas sp. ZAC14D2_NAIMI4_6]
MQSNGVILQSHHVLEKSLFVNNELLDKLVERGLIDPDSSANRLYLAVNGGLAEDLEASPHRGRTRSSYTSGVTNAINAIGRSGDGIAALNDDLAALKRVASRVEELRDTLKVALINGDLFATTPNFMTSRETDEVNLRTIGARAQYRIDHAVQLNELNRMRPVESEWAAMVRSDSRVGRLLDEVLAKPQNLVAGPGERDALAREVAGRMEMRLAVSDAEQSGRLALSEATRARVQQTLVDDLPGIGRARADLYDLTHTATHAYKPVSQRGFVTLDVLIGEASASQLVRSGGLLASGVDAILTTQRISEHLQQGNGTAAQSEFNHTLARSGGGWLGGMATASLIGTSSFVPAAVVAADALFMSKAFDKGADLLDNRAVYQQEDAAGVLWKFDRLNWQRQAKLEDAAERSPNAVEFSVGASYEKARELGAKASASAVELALGKAPEPQNPFNLPAGPQDVNGLDNQNWQRDPQTEQWIRQVKTDVVGANDRGVYETQIATPERAAELNRQAVQRIEDNIAHGKAAIAASYLEARAASRASDFVPLVPDAVDAARAKPDAILGSDNTLYHRDAAGQWSHQGVVAQGNMALELELTRTIQQPSLDALERSLAELEARPAPTNAEMNRNEVRHRYASAGITPSPQWMDAIELAMERTRSQHGINGPTLQQLAPPVDGVAGESRAITHYQVGEDGVARPAATTSTEELQAAWREVRERAGEQAPIPESPELRIAALSPREQEAYQQALQEANRQGAATVDAGQVASAAAQHARPDDPAPADARDAVAEAQRAAERQRPPTPVEPTAAAAPPVLPAGPTRERDPNALLPTDDPRTSQPSRQVEETAEPERRTEAAQHPAPQVEAERPATAHSTPVAAEPSLQPSHDTTPESLPTQAEAAPVTAQRVRDEPTEREPMAHASTVVADPPPPPPAPDVEMEPAAPLQNEPEATQVVPEGTAEQPAVDRAVAPEGEQTAVKPAPAPEVVLEETVPEAAAPASAPQPGTVEPLQGAPEDTTNPTRPGHADYPLYQQICERVQDLDARYGRSFDATSERVAASLLVLAKDNDLERVDHVLVSNATAEHPAGHRLFVVQGDPADPAHRRADMPTEQAVQTPVEESLQAFDAVSHEAAQRAAANLAQQQLEDERVQQDIQVRAASAG